MSETWKTVPNHPDYEVSDHGNVRSHKFGEVYNLHPVPNKYRNNYLQFSCHTNGARQLFKVHVIVAALFIGPRPAGLDIRHLDGNSQNNDVRNLAYGTRLENVKDQFRHGTRGYELRPYCRHGHAYTPENACYSGGKRYCRACSKDRYAAHAEDNAKRAREYRARKRAEAMLAV